jgi:hypothetical protein
MCFSIHREHILYTGIKDKPISIKQRIHSQKITRTTNRKSLFSLFLSISLSFYLSIFLFLSVSLSKSHPSLCNIVTHTSLLSLSPPSSLHPPPLPLPLQFNNAETSQAPLHRFSRANSEFVGPITDFPFPPLPSLSSSPSPSATSRSRLRPRGLLSC